MNKVRAMILSMLKDASGAYVSSRVICETAQISRTAVWKHIQALQKQGYEIQAVTHKGYRLADTVDFVTPNELSEHINTKVMGRHITYRASVDSTNRLARMLAEQGAEEGTLVIADEQTQGRGRLNRKWYSPAHAGVWMSLIIRPCITIADASRLTILTAAAVAMALTELLNQQACIKWPNDILLNGKKACGILTEISVEGNLVNYCVIGIGINVNVSTADLPTDLQPSVLSLHEIMEQPVKRAYVVAKILAAFEMLYDHYLQHGDFTCVLNYIRQNSATINRYVEVDTGITKIPGFAVDVDEYGALLVRTEDQQIKKLFSGDVILVKS